MFQKYDYFEYEPSESSSRKYFRRLTSLVYVIVLAAIVGASLWSCLQTWLVINHSLFASIPADELNRLASDRGINLFIPVNPLGIMSTVVICMAAVACATGFVGAIQHLSPTIRNTQPYKCLLPAFYLLFLVFLVVAGVMVSGTCFGISELVKAADSDIKQQLNRAGSLSGGQITADIAADLDKLAGPLLMLYNIHNCQASNVTCSSPSVGKISCSKDADPNIVSIFNEVCSAPPRLEGGMALGLTSCTTCINKYGPSPASEVICLCSSQVKMWIDAVSPKEREVWVRTAFINVIIAALCAALLIAWIIRRARPALCSPFTDLINSNRAMMELREREGYKLLFCMALELIARTNRWSMTCSIWSFLYVIFLVLFAAFAIYSTAYTCVNAKESIVTHVSPQQLMDLAAHLGVAIFLPVNPVRASWVVAIIIAIILPIAAVFGIIYHCSSTVRSTKPWKYIVGGTFWGLLLLTFVGALLVGGTGIGMSIIGKLSMEEIQRVIEEHPDIALALITLRLIKDYHVTIPYGIGGNSKKVAGIANSVPSLECI
ncbi:hypothetical protein FOL47_006820 [Perkinsus chesapeaki]|uniref:Uncharacterized protein n=1 Tax=Perkinsus chesapeaki TaxID=330153 RepID=A0A7J6MXR6_PERCH|nr:hypothetical protein FOL47_006820 [Perkinsus chesapeaki]